MKQKTLSLSLFIILLLVFIPAITFSRSMISGQVIDAETEEPIENAAFYINWWKITGIPGLTSASHVEVAEGYTDAEGNFKIPNRLFLRNIEWQSIKKDMCVGAVIRYFRHGKKEKILNKKQDGY